MCPCSLWKGWMHHCSALRAPSNSGLLKCPKKVSFSKALTVALDLQKSEAGKPVSIFSQGKSRSCWTWFVQWKPSYCLFGIVHPSTDSTPAQGCSTPLCLAGRHGSAFWALRSVSLPSRKFFLFRAFLGQTLHSSSRNCLGCAVYLFHFTAGFLVLEVWKYFQKDLGLKLNDLLLATGPAFSGRGMVFWRNVA